MCKIGEEYILFLKTAPRDFAGVGTLQVNILSTGPQSKLKVTNGRAYSVVGSEFDGVPISQMISEIEQAH
jgi:hypothetical protein